MRGCRCPKPISPFQRGHNLLNGKGRKNTSTSVGRAVTFLAYTHYISVVTNGQNVMPFTWTLTWEREPGDFQARFKTTPSTRFVFWRYRHYKKQKSLSTYLDHHTGHLTIAAARGRRHAGKRDGIRVARAECCHVTSSWADPQKKKKKIKIKTQQDGKVILGPGPTRVWRSNRTIPSFSTALRSPCRCPLEGKVKLSLPPAPGRARVLVSLVLSDAVRGGAARSIAGEEEEGLLECRPIITIIMDRVTAAAFGSSSSCTIYTNLLFTMKINMHCAIYRNKLPKNQREKNKKKKDKWKKNYTLYKLYKEKLC